MTTEQTEICGEVEERMAEILDGSAPPALLDHLADCDRCRDARHDAQRALELVAASPGDYEPPADLEARIVAALDAGAAAKPEMPAAPAPPRDTEPLSAQPETAATPKTTADAAKSPEASAPATVSAAPKAISGRGVWAIAGGLALAAAAALVIRGAGEDSRGGKGEGWRGKITRVSSAGGEGRLELCDPSGKSCSAARAPAALPAGSLVRTDERTLAELELSDGSTFVLDRSSELLFDGNNVRRAKLVRGGMVADISHEKDSQARIDLSRGRVEVLATKFSLRSGSDFAVVDVSRGNVKLVDEDERSVGVRAGEEGRLYSGTPPYVSAKPGLDESLLIGESAFGQADKEPPPRALGELRAKKPGQNDELSGGAVTLSSHAVRVRISGAVARTEIDEVFANTTDDVLEGVYRFPLPPDAKIEKLALEVDGKLENGAFVDRDRAAAIWRGAIVNAAPQARQQFKEEIVWVPGPWKDPALLEWQRGGRFELRIFPIPKRGSRRVVLAYTQLIQPSAGVRRYNYPLAHDPSGSTRVGDFSVDVQVRGHDSKFGVRPAGYTLAQSAGDGADKLTMAAKNFVPSGDLSFEYALPDRNSELTVWAYRGQTTQSGTAVTPEQPYVALALRPKLPRMVAGEEGFVALVVDASRSMFGESYRRATAVATRMVRELDAGDRVTVFACDVECRALPGGARRPGAEAADEVRRFLEGVTPEGGSDVTASVQNALSAGQRAGSRNTQVVYIGDGTPTVGPIRPATVTRAIEETMLRTPGRVTAVAVGSDSDLDTLSALARGGGGIVLPYTPGQGVAQAAFAALGTLYTSALRNVELVLPEGLSEVAPRRLDTLGAGSETLVVARMNNMEVSGTVLLRGKLDGKPFEQRYPVRIAASDSSGNAFVPRLYAGAMIADLERDGSAEAKKRAIELSTRFDTASRYTSLLVLESPAMFKAFGLDNAQSLPTWTGEEASESTTAEGEVDFDEAKDLALGGGDAIRPGAGGGSIAGTGSKGRSAAAPKAAKKPEAFGRFDDAPAPSPAPSAPPPAREIAEPSARGPANLAPGDTPGALELERRRRPRMIPMRKIWERVGEVSTDRLIPKAATIGAIGDAEREASANENRRAAVKKLYALLAVSSDLERAGRVAERWSGKDPLDPDALTARADLEARRGNRDAAIRILGSVVDVRPSDVAAQKRLARLHRWAGRPALGCRHSIAIAELHPADAKLLAEALRCTENSPDAGLSDTLRAAADQKTQTAVTALLQAKPVDDSLLSGDLKIEASWSGDSDLDLAVLDGEGRRASWLGAPTRSIIAARDVLSTRSEGLSLSKPAPGEYVIEIARASGGGRVSGELTVTIGKNVRRVPFSLDGQRATVALANVRMQSRLVPLNF